MHDDELRARLASLIEPDAAGPAPEAIRDRGRRRRRSVFAGAAAVVVTVAVVTASVVAWQRPFAAVPAASPSPSTTPAPTSTATPTSTPSRVTPPPGLTCEAVRTAWRGALLSTTTFPAVLGTKPRLEWVSGATWVASGIVRGQRVLRVFPEGLTGNSYTLQAARPGVQLLGMGNPEGRVAFMELSEGASTWPLMTVDAPGSAPRRVMVGGIQADGRSKLMPWVVGDVVRYFDMPSHTDKGPGHVTIYEVSLTTPNAAPRAVLEFDGMSPTLLWGAFLGDVVVLNRYDGSMVAFDRQTLADAPVPVGLDPERGAQSGDASRFVFRGGDQGEELWVQDVATGDRRLVVAKEPNWAMLSGNLVLYGHGPRVLLSDLDSGNTVEVLTTSTGYKGQMFGLYRGFLSRESDTAGDGGMHMSIASLPQSVPAC